MPNSTSFTSIPAINISGLFSENKEDRLSVAEALGKAAKDIGFLYVTGHNIDPKLTEDLRLAAKQFFSQEMDEKLAYYIGTSKTHKGYVPKGEEIYGGGKPDHKEAFDIGFPAPKDHPLVLANTPLIGDNEWPELVGFQEKVRAYYHAVFELGRRLFSGFALALGLPEDYFDSMVTCPPSKLRLIHYPFDASAKDAPGIGAHTDYECFTLLLADQAGLEVLNEDDVWIDTPPLKEGDEEAFVVNIGDMLEVLTAGQFVATSHRVRKVSQERYSFPLFMACDYHTQIKPLPQFSNADTEQEYEAISIGDHMYSQALQTYSYLRKKVADGELALPEKTRVFGSFGRLKKSAN